MMRRGRNCVGALRYHSCTGYIADNFCTRKMSSYTGLCALSHLYLYRRTGVQVFLMNAESSRRNLYYGIFAVTVKILMKSALARIVANTEFLCGSGKAFMCVIAYGAIAHCREHNRHGKLYLRRKIRLYSSVFVTLDFLRLFTEKDPCFHGLTKRIYGRVRNL